MLVLTRKTGEEVVIGDNIFIRIVGVDGRKVRIGIVAPKDVIVDRQEVRELRLNTNKEADDIVCQPT